VLYIQHNRAQLSFSQQAQLHAASPELLLTCSAFVSCSSLAQFLFLLVVYRCDYMYIIHQNSPFGRYEDDSDDLDDGEPETHWQPEKPDTDDEETEETSTEVYTHIYTYIYLHAFLEKEAHTYV
jgi:hypothetical protein